MNQLIREIANVFESVKAETENGFCHSNYDYFMDPSSYEEFAKAIINECIKSIENAVDRFGPTAVDDIKETIKNHFGE